MSSAATEEVSNCKIVVNHDEQYSIWPADRQSPPGWREVGRSGTKSQCLAYIKEVWADMKPLGLRTKKGRGGGRCLHECFEAQVGRTPEAVALSCENLTLTYAELNRRANQLAHYLRKLGVGPEVLVGLCVERSLEMAVGILAILKAGGAYVPLDPTYPRERLAFMVEDSKVAIVLTQHHLLHYFSPQVQTVSLDSAREGIAQESGDNPQTEVSPDNLLYVIYTSGSTGRPKGVMVTHANVVRLFAGARALFEFDERDVWTFFHSYAFGFSVWELWGALLHGGRLVIVPLQVSRSPQALTELLRSEGITVLSQTPSAFRQLLSARSEARTSFAPSLRFIFFSGEPVVVQDLKSWFERHGDQSPQLINTYAITETGGQITFRRLTRMDVKEGRENFIGQCLSDLQVYILDQELQPIALETRGELYIQGAGLARGYLHQPELTAEKFLPDPLGTVPGARLYRTGDSARPLSSGEIEHLGRVDGQVKIRGFRVELSEIETALRDLPAVREATVVVRERETGQKSLVAYVVPRRSTSVPAGVPHPAAGIGADDQLEWWPSLGEHLAYDELLYYVMSHDPVRNEKYRGAIDRLVKDKIVVDVGTGQEAFLARLAVEAGARRVYAIEVLDEAYEKAAARVKNLELEDKITLIHGDSREVRLPELADVCLSALIGNIGSSDGVVALLNDARRFLREEGVLMPKGCTTRIAPVELPDELRKKPGFSRIAASYVAKLFEQVGRQFDVRLCVRNFPQPNLIADSAVFEELDFMQPPDPASGGNATFIVKRKSTFDGFLLWTSVVLVEGQVIDSLSRQLGWLPVYFPAFHPPVEVSEGDVIKAVWDCTLSANGLNPDYSIRGSVISANGHTGEFAYTSRYDERAFKDTWIHERLFSQDWQASSDLSAATLRASLAERLPDYMIPAVFVSLDALPRSPNGKIDRQALPVPDRTRLEVGETVVPPRTPVEKGLAEIFAEVLGLGRVGVRDSFFLLGGDSLLATSITSRVRSTFHVELPLEQLFETPTIEGLALAIVEFQTKNAERDEIDRILADLEGLSEEEAQRLLSEGG